MNLAFSVRPSCECIARYTWSELFVISRILIFHTEQALCILATGLSFGTFSRSGFGRFCRMRLNLGGPLGANDCVFTGEVG